MGNSNGTLAEYWDAIESTPGLQGGFIWEFWDHGLVQTLPDGRTRWAYGGDFGEQPHDGNFVCDGMVWPDRRPKPAMWEHKRLAAPVRVSGSPEDLAAGRVELANHQHFSDLGWLRASYSLTVGGDEVAAGAFGLPDLGPGERATRGAPRLGGAVGRRRRGVPDGPLHDRRRSALGAGRLRGLRRCSCRSARRRAAPATGCRRAGPGADPCRSTRTAASSTRCSRAAPTLSLWRAPTDNDRIGGMAARWATLGVDRLERRLVGDRSRRRTATVVRTEFVTGGRDRRSSTRPPTPAWPTAASPSRRPRRCPTS